MIRRALSAVGELVQPVSIILDELQEMWLFITSYAKLSGGS